VSVGEPDAGADRVLVLERVHRLPGGKNRRLELLLRPVDEHLTLDERHHERREVCVVGWPEERAGRSGQAPDERAGERRLLAFCSGACHGTRYCDERTEAEKHKAQNTDENPPPPPQCRPVVQDICRHFILLLGYTGHDATP